MRGDRGGAGPAAAGLGDARAAFPHPQPDAVGPGYSRDLHIRAFGEHRVMFDIRPQGGQIDRLGVLDEEDAMRIAHVDGRGVGQRSLFDGQRQCISRFPQRDFRPIQPRRAHVHRDDAVRTGLGGQQPGRRFDRRRRPARLFHQRGGDATGAVAAGRRFAAVRIIEAEARVGAVVIRLIYQDKLIEADAAATVGDGANPVRRELDGRAAPVDHDEVVAETMHLGERDHRCHPCEHSLIWRRRRASLGN